MGGGREGGWGEIWRVLSNFLEVDLVEMERELGQRSRV